MYILFQDTGIGCSAADAQDLEKETGLFGTERLRRKGKRLVSGEILAVSHVFYH